MNLRKHYNHRGTNDTQKYLSGEEVQQMIRRLGHYGWRNFDDMQKISSANIPKEATSEQVLAEAEEYYFGQGRHRWAMELWEIVGNYKRAREICEGILIPADHYDSDRKHLKLLRKKEKGSKIRNLEEACAN